MVFLSKQGKDVLPAIDSIKDKIEPNRLAKIWLNLARNASTTQYQYQAYNKTLEILRKENSIKIVEVVIEFSEWLLRSDYSQDIIS